MEKIYLDYNATTPLLPEVIEEMLPYLREHFGNPSSGHWSGTRARDAIEEARSRLAELLGCQPSEVIFTSGGTESDNYAIKGIAEAWRDKGNHIITSSVEHPAVINSCKYLEEKGFRVTYLPVDEHGMVDPDAVENAITAATILITIMHANNEVGTLQPLGEIGKIARSHGVSFHTDAAQSVGKVRTRTDELGVDLLTVAGHKFYAPKGVGALYIRQGTRIANFMHGAGHEEGRRAGTENLTSIVGLGKAAEMAATDVETFGKRVTALRDRLQESIANQVGEMKLNGHPTRRLPNTLNLSFPGIDGDSLLEAIPEIAASTGSACHTHSKDPSSVLLTMGVDRDLALGTIRLSLGKPTTPEEVDFAAKVIGEKVIELQRR